MNRHNAIATQKIEKGATGFDIAGAIVGAVSDEYGESGYMWAWFNRKDIPQHLIDMHLDKDSEYDLAYVLTSWESWSNGVGRSFASEPYCKIGRNHILVKQHRGLDV